MVTEIYLGAFESRYEFTLRDLSVAIGIDQLKDVVGLGLGEFDIELLEDQLEEIVGFLAVEESAAVLVEGRPNVVDYLSDI